MAAPRSEYPDSSVHFAPEPRQIRVKFVRFGEGLHLILGMGLGLGSARPKSAPFRGKARPEVRALFRKTFRVHFRWKFTEIRLEFSPTRSKMRWPPEFFKKKKQHPMIQS